jgi:hypothetical protein
LGEAWRFKENSVNQKNLLFLDGKNHLFPAAQPDILALFTSGMQKKDSEFPTGA